MRKAMAGLIVTIAVFGIVAAACADTPLDRLIAGAKKEQKLTVTLFPRISPEVAAKMEAAFNARYGLSIKVEADLTGRYSTKAAQGVIEQNTGAPPSYDVMVLPEAAFEVLDGAKAVEPIADWDQMLPEGADKTISPGPIQGRGFIAYDLYWGFSYNSDKIASADMPSTMPDFGKPQYKGKMAISDFATNWTYALMRYSPDEFLKIVAGWGANQIVMMHPEQMAQHLALGEYSLGLDQTTEQVVSAQKAGQNIKMAVWKDVVPHGVLVYAVRKGAKSPNAAKLFTLWLTGREAVAFVGQSTEVGSRLYAGSEAIDLALKLAGAAGVKPVGFFDSDETYKTLHWLGTKDGDDYNRKLTNAMRGQ